MAATRSSGLFGPSEAIGDMVLRRGHHSALRPALSNSHGLRFQGIAMNHLRDICRSLSLHQRGELFLSTVPFLSKMKKNCEFTIPDSLTPESIFPETSVLKESKLLKFCAEALITSTLCPPFVHSILEDTGSLYGLSTYLGPTWFWGQYWIAHLRQDRQQPWRNGLPHSSRQHVHSASDCSSVLYCLCQLRNHSLVAGNTHHM